MKPNVEFGDSVSESPESVARTLQLLAAAEAVSVDTKVRTVHPEWDDDQVKEEVARIRQDAGRDVVNPDTFTGADAGSGQNDPGGLQPPPGE